MAKIAAVHVPAELKNHFINGGLDIWQEKAGTTTTVNTATTTLTKFADMFAINSQGATSKNYSVVRSTDVPTFAQSGYQSTYSELFTMLTGIASPAASDWVSPCQYSMEGLDYQKLHSKTVTFGLWVKASIAGTYSFALGNAAGNRSYVTTFTMNGAATWEFKAITVTLDNTGTYNFDTGTGLLIYIASVTGSTFQTSTLNQWQAGTFFAASTGTNWQGTTNATFQVAQLSLLEGSLGLGPTGFARVGKDYQQELAMCLRYYWKSGANSVLCAGEFNTTTAVRGIIQYPVQMRTTPSLSVSAGTDLVLDRPGTSAASGTGTPSYAGIGVDSVLINATSGSASTTGFATMISFQNNGFFVADARL